MAGRFSFSVPERRNASDPWFRIGTLDVTTTIVVLIASVASMFVWAIHRSLFAYLILDPGAVRHGELWRLLTWPIANEPGLWPVITLAIFWYFGREVEGMVGRTRFAVMLLVLTVIPGIVAVALDIAMFGLAPVELAIFLVFIAQYPFARFFFGIPAWAIGAVVVGIQVLQYLGNRQSELIVLLAVTIILAGLTARSMGLAESLPWIPKVPYPSRSARRKRKANRGGGGEVISGPWSATSRSGPVRTSSLPQPPPSMDDQRDQIELDDLLEKIHADGLDSLTSAEKRRLNELSTRLRNRK